MSHHLILGSCLVLTSLFLSIPPAHASTFRVVHPRKSLAPAAARPAAVTAEAPRKVRLVYFRPNDRPYRAEVVDSLKAAILRVQAFFGEEMQRHGHGNLTFRFEADDQGQPLVHRVDGENADAHYLEQAGAQWEIWRAIGHSPIDIMVLDLSTGTVPYLAGGAAGVASPSRGEDGLIETTVLLPGAFSWRVVAHELGHAFGLQHDFRDSEYIMSYGGGNRARLSACAAGVLAVCPDLNPDIPLPLGTSPSTIDLVSPVRYQAGSDSIPVRLRIGRSSGLHQGILFATTQLPHFAVGHAEVKACRSFSGESAAVVEFDYDGLIPSNDLTNLSSPIVHRMSFQAVDELGRASGHEFVLYQLSDRHIATLEEPGVLTSLAFSPDGTTLASAAWESSIKLWDVGTRDIIASLPSSPTGAVAISPDGETLASEHNVDVELWDLATGTRTDTLEGRWGGLPRDDPGDSGYRSVAFSPRDGNTLAVVTGDSTVKLWDLATGANYADLNHESRVTSLAFSPDGSRLAVAGGDGTVNLWDPAAGNRVTAWEAHAGLVGAVTFSPDGSILASQAGWDGLVRLWDVETQRVVADIENTRGGSALAFSPDGATLACASGPLVKLWDVETRARIDSLGHRATVKSLAFSPDGETLASGTRMGIELWDATEWLKPRPHELVEISGDGQEGSPGATLENPLVVEVRDQHGNGIEGALVTFAVIEGGGRLDEPNKKTDANGRAVVLLTLGTDPGTNTVEATLLGVDPVTFTATARATPDFDGDGEVGFADFLLFAEAFGGSDPRFDLDASGTVDFADFFLFAESFGQPARARLMALARERIGLPDGPQLRQNWPNPFNRGTVISWFLLQPGPARLEVFALNGQRVAVLSQADHEAGLHRLRWDGRDDRGRPLASGTYLYRLVTAEHVSARKFVLIR